MWREVAKKNLEGRSKFGESMRRKSTGEFAASEISHMLRDF